jgi:hypothetical protein
LTSHSASFKSPANGGTIVLAWQPAYQRCDLVPGFAGYDQLTVLNLVCLQFQSSRSAIGFYRKSGHARWSVNASGYASDCLGCYAGEVQFFPDVIDDFEFAQIE